MWESRHPGRWRTWIRAHLPWFLVDLGIARKGRDCEAVGGWHHWYNVDNESGACYHCEIVRSGQLRNDRESGADSEDSNDSDADDVECCRGISQVQGDTLRVTIPEWLAGMLRIEEGDFVSIDNANEKFNIRLTLG